MWVLQILPLCLMSYLTKIYITFTKEKQLNDMFNVPNLQKACEFYDMI